MYCLYLRKSRADMDAEARGEGETLARHRTALLALAKSLRIDIVKEYSEVETGESIAARPVAQQLLSDVEKGTWSGVLVMEVERLARGDTIDQGIVANTFKYSNTKIITPIKTYDPNNEYDEEYFEFGLFMSRREYKVINRRMQRGKIASVNEGKFVGSVPPYGYDVEKLSKGNTLKPNENSQIVKMIFDLYTSERKGVSLIARRLNDLKIPARKSDIWTTSTIRDILINPVYAGKIRWDWRPNKKSMENGNIIVHRPRTSNYKIVQGMHTAIISNEQFELAQYFMMQNKPVPVPTRYTVKNPLSGIVICGMCGRKMNRKPYKSIPDILLCAEPQCNNISSYLHIVEDRILLGLEDWVKEYKIISSAKTENVLPLEKAIEFKSKELNTLEKQKTKTYELLEQGIYSSNIFMERNKAIALQINEVKESIDKLNSEIESKRRLAYQKNQLVPKVEKLLDVYRNISDPKLKNDMLKEVLEKVVYAKETGGRWKKQDDFILELYPKLPHG